MIRKPKKLSFNPLTVSVAAILFALLVFFIYASFFNRIFFAYLCAGLIVIIGVLFYTNFLYIRMRVSHDLKKEEYLELINVLNAEISREEQNIEAFRKKILNYSQLKWLVENLASTFTVEDTVSTLTSETNRFFGARNITVILYLFHPRTNDLGIASSQSNQEKVQIKAKKGDAYDQWVLKNLKPLLLEDARNDFRFDANRIAEDDPRVVSSLISVPLISDQKVLGILRVDSLEEHFFDTEDLRFLTIIGDLASITIENAQLYERVEDLAVKDSLTGLFLRRHFLELFSLEINRQARSKREVSFLMVDLDYFKDYNDTFGHMAGDIVLKTVGTIIRDTFRDPGDVVCRYGGEEFAVVLPDCPKSRAVELAESLRRKIEKQAIVLRRKKTKITASVGVATFPKDAQLMDDLIQRADQALYQAKQSGRNKVVSASIHKEGEK